MDREIQANNARAFVEEIEKVMHRYSDSDFKQSFFLDDTLDPTDYLDTFKAAFIRFRIANVLRESRVAVLERQVEIDSQVITRADLRRWMEARQSEPSMDEVLASLRGVIGGVE